MTQQIMIAYRLGLADGAKQRAGAPHDGAWEGERPGNTPPDGWAADSAHASGYRLSVAEEAAEAGAYIAGYVTGWAA